MSKPILVFDATALAHGNFTKALRSGIFWVSFNLLKQFLQTDQLEIWLYCPPHWYFWLNRSLKKYFPGQRFTFVNQKEMKPFTMGYSGFNALLCFPDICQNKLKYLFCIGGKYVCMVGKWLESPWTKWNNSLQQVPYFFSPMLTFPQSIQNAPHIQKIIILYDLIPVLYPNLYPQGSPWLTKIIASLNTQNLYIAISESTRQDFLKIAPQIPSQHITTTYISTNQPYEPQTDPARVAQVKAKYHIPTNKSYVFSLCTMNPHKNIPFAIDGFIRFCQQYNVHDQLLVLGGSATDKRLDKYKNSPYVKFIGYVDDEDLQTLYSAADTFVYPSLYEGFGMPILEAMSCGCPVICSNTSSMPEVIGDCGILIDPTNEQDLINAFHKMHTDATFRQTCREKGLARAKQFSWEQCAQTIINKLLSARAGQKKGVK